MLNRRSEALVTEFPGDALALGALGVPELEARARSARPSSAPTAVLGRVTIEVPRQKPLERGWRRHGTYPPEWNSVSPGGGAPWGVGGRALNRGGYRPSPRAVGVDGWLTRTRAPRSAAACRSPAMTGVRRPGIPALRQLSIRLWRNSSRRRCGGAAVSHRPVLWRVVLTILYVEFGKGRGARRSRPVVGRK
jgi:hypothetical protein